jgi:hypothetical protein
MKKLFKIVPVFILSLLLFAQSAYADIAVPGGKGGSPGRVIPKNELIIYGVVGGVIIVAVIISVIALIKIRRKNVSK